MSRSRQVPVLVLVLLVGEQVFGASWHTVFRDDFDSGVGAANSPDPERWIVNHPASYWWTQGRTFFPSPQYHPDAPFPHVENGACVIEHHLYNPYDLAVEPWTFLGGEIRTAIDFSPQRSYRFEARVRCHEYPGGVVTSFFSYGYDGSESDEIDFEFLSKKTNDNATYPTGDPVLTNTWNESLESPEYVPTEGLDLCEWNTLRIYWHPDLSRIEWTCDFGCK